MMTKERRELLERTKKQMEKEYKAYAKAERKGWWI